mmetsp:Transcript_37363/g.81939  ORF Transcript_37363/g.81939 Transcript_37363/m.81939 type:complete len:98 (-) Transcript_37363:2590-2883(-)
MNAIFFLGKVPVGYGSTPYYFKVEKPFLKPRDISAGFCFFLGVSVLVGDAALVPGEGSSVIGRFSGVSAFWTWSAIPVAEATLLLMSETSVFSCSSA